MVGTGGGWTAGGRGGFRRWHDNFCANGTVVPLAFAIMPLSWKRLLLAGVKSASQQRSKSTTDASQQVSKSATKQVNNGRATSMIQKTLAMIQKKTFEIQKSVGIQGKSEQDMSGAMRERPRKVRRSWCASVLACLMTCGPAWADSGDSWTFTLNADSTTQGLLTSGDWTLRAALTAAGADTLGLGYGNWADPAAAYVAGSGVLDLTTPIWQGERRLSLTHVRQTAFLNLPKTVAVRHLLRSGSLRIQSEDARQCACRGAAGRLFGHGGLRRLPDGART